MEHKWISFIVLAFVGGLFIGHLFVHGCDSDKGRHGNKGYAGDRDYKMEGRFMKNRTDKYDRGFGSRQEEHIKVYFDEGGRYRQGFNF